MTDDEKYNDSTSGKENDKLNDDNDILKKIRDRLAEATKEETRRAKARNVFYEKARISYEGALMSWIRTAISLISLGFTIYEFFKEYQAEDERPHLLTSRGVGLFMIAFGFISLLFAHIQHHMAFKRLRESSPGIRRSFASVFSAVILLFALLIFLAVLFRQ